MTGKKLIDVAQPGQNWQEERYAHWHKDPQDVIEVGNYKALIKARCLYVCVSKLSIESAAASIRGTHTHTHCHSNV